MQEIVDIVYFYEHAARELDVACAVASSLQHLGVRIEVIHWPTGFPTAVTRYRPRLVVLPFCYSIQSYLSLLAYWPDPVFFNATWEQLFYLGNREAKTPRGEFPVEHVIHHSWSREYVEFLKQSGIPEERIFLNGQPAYSLYDKPYRGYYESRGNLASRHGLDAAKRWVFFPENYNWAFYSENTLQRFIDSGQSPEDVHSMRVFCEKSLAHVLDWCQAAAGNASFELILRPRPSSTLDDFKRVVLQHLKTLPAGMHINQDGSVREWILASDVVVSSHSTSLIEAAVAGKPVYILEPSPIPRPLEADWQKNVPHINDMEAFQELCLGGSCKDRPGIQLERWARSTLMSRGDSIANLAVYLSVILNSTRRIVPLSVRRIALPGIRCIPPASLWSLYRRMKQFIRYPRTGGIEPEYVKDVISRPAMESRIARWGRIAGC
jgi:surface carbohydrate biosynthesis protein